MCSLLPVHAVCWQRRENESPNVVVSMTGFIFHSNVIRVDLSSWKDIEGWVVGSSTEHRSWQSSLPTWRRGRDTVVVLLVVSNVVLWVVTLIVVGRVVSLRFSKEESPDTCTLQVRRWRRTFFEDRRRSSSRSTSCWSRTWHGKGSVSSRRWTGRRDWVVSSSSYSWVTNSVVVVTVICRIRGSSWQLRGRLPSQNQGMRRRRNWSDGSCIRRRRSGRTRIRSWDVALALIHSRGCSVGCNFLSSVLFLLLGRWRRKIILIGFRVSSSEWDWRRNPIEILPQVSSATFASTRFIGQVVSESMTEKQVYVMSKCVASSSFYSEGCSMGYILRRKNKTHEIDEMVQRRGGKRLWESEGRKEQTGSKKKIVGLKGSSGLVCQDSHKHCSLSKNYTPKKNCYTLKDIEKEVEE